MHAEPPSHHCAHKGSCRWPCQWSVFLQSIIKYGVTIVVKQTMRQISSLLTKDYMRPECNNFTLFNESYVNIRLYSLQFASPCCVQMTSMLSEIQLTEFQTQNWWRERVRERKKEGFPSMLMWSKWLPKHSVRPECSIFTPFSASNAKINFHPLRQSWIMLLCASDIN